jgi:hypothetical protein
MSATFDATTKAAYDAATTAADRATAIVAALTGTITVAVYNGADAVMGTGTMAAPWATASGGSVLIGEVSSFTVGTTATPDANWYIRFENSDASRWARGSFGLSASSQDFTWSLASWEAAQTGTIGTATIVCTGNAAPAFTVAPTTASIAATGGTIQFTAVDPEGASVIYSLTTTRAGITINSTTGLVTVTAAAAGTSGNIVVQASDGILTASATCAVTVGSAVDATFTIVAVTGSRTFDGAAPSGKDGAAWVTDDGETRLPEPGDVIELAHGTHGPLVFQNFAGLAAQPITIRNGNGVVIVRRTSAATGSFVLSLRNCQHVTLDGSNAGESYGIQVMYASSGTDAPSAFIQLWDNGAGLAAGTPTEAITIRYVEVDGGWPTNSTDGIGIQLNDGDQFTRALHPTQVRDGLLIEHCYVHDVEGEGMYIGPNWTDGDIPVTNVEIRYNTVDDTGWDGIQVKSCFEGTNSIHHNTVRRVGSRMDALFYQHYGIAIDSGRGDIYANWIEDSGHHGIQVYTASGPTTGYDPFPAAIYNNVIVRPGSTYYVAGDSTDGIVTGSQTGTIRVVPAIYNNTIIDPQSRAIDVNSNTTSGFVTNNICIDSSGVSAPGGVTVTNNPTSATFVDDGADDYHLAAASLASGTVGTDIAATDFDGDARANGTADCGAYEWP